MKNTHIPMKNTHFPYENPPKTAVWDPKGAFGAGKGLDCPKWRSYHRVGAFWGGFYYENSVFYYENGFFYYEIAVFFTMKWHFLR
jgi:hypothetical protein